MFDFMCKSMLVLVSITCVACSGKVAFSDQHSLDYLESQPGKPVIYPAGVKPLESSPSFAVPELSAEQQQSEYDIDELIEPPRLVPAPISEDDEQEED
jgi:uncharacterized lipoprotein